MYYCAYQVRGIFVVAITAKNTPAALIRGLPAKKRLQRTPGMTLGTHRPHTHGTQKYSINSSAIVVTGI